MNQVYSFIGLCIIATSIYVFCADWGELDSSFFHGIASILLLFGVIVTLTTYLGDKGTELMMNPPLRDSGLGAGPQWTGKQMLVIYFVTLLGGFLFTMFIFVLSLSAIESVRENEAALAAGTLGIASKRFHRFVSNRFSTVI